MVRGSVGSMRPLWLGVESEGKVVRALALRTEYVREFLRKGFFGSRHTARPQ